MSASIQPVRLAEAADAASGSRREESTGFASVLQDAIVRVEEFHRQAGQEVDRLLNGEGEDLHGVILATQRADLAFELFTQVRNKVIQAYQEVMRMQV